MSDTTLDRAIAAVRAAYEDGSEGAVVVFGITSRREAAELWARLQAAKEKKAKTGWRIVTRHEQGRGEQ